MDAEEFMEQMDGLWFVHNILMPPSCNSVSAPFMDAATLPRSSSEEESKILRHQTEPLPSPVDQSYPPELPEPESKPTPHLEHVEAITASRLEGRKKIRRRRREGMVGSERAADLEFQELKGFLDLGFSFGGGMVDQRLISIIPGLQRERGAESSVGLYRPYLSDAWLCRIPFRNEDVSMKEDLKSWAHAVACSVR